MSDTVIKVENLGKRYRIGSGDTGYKTFRETIVDAAKAPFLRAQEAWSMARRAWNRRHGALTTEHGEKAKDASQLFAPGSELQALGSQLPADGDTFWALKDVSFEVKQGEVVGIIGRNGAGKSTLLKILSKITEPTEGRVELRGKVGSLLEVGTGFHPELTGHENVYLYGAILGMDRWEITRKFDEIIAFAELEKFVDTPVKHYSSGMYMRLAFAVAAHMEPEILLVDEVLAVGDAAFQKKCLGKMGDVAGGGRTVLFVSHNMGAVGSLCQKVILINGGRINFNGDTSIAIERYFDQIKTLSDLELSERQDRKGSGVCRFKRLSFEDENGHNLEVIRSGQTLRIVLNYESDRKKDLHSVKVGIIIYHRMLGQIMYCDNITAGQLKLSIPSNGRLTCTIKRLPLNPGLYSISVFLKTGRELLDLIEDAATFQIEEGDFFGTGKLPPKGIFLLDNYSWSITE